MFCVTLLLLTACKQPKPFSNNYYKGVSTEEYEPQLPTIREVVLESDAEKRELERLGGKGSATNAVGTTPEISGKPFFYSLMEENKREAEVVTTSAKSQITIGFYNDSKEGMVDKLPDVDVKVPMSKVGSKNIYTPCEGEVTNYSYQTGKARSVTISCNMNNKEYNLTFSSLDQLWDATELDVPIEDVASHEILYPTNVDALNKTKKRKAGSLIGTAGLTGTELNKEKENISNIGIVRIEITGKDSASSGNFKEVTFKDFFKEDNSKAGELQSQ